MYYPEANVLVPRHVDPASKTPAFKSDSGAGRGASAVCAGARRACLPCEPLLAAEQCGSGLLRCGAFFCRIRLEILMDSESQFLFITCQVGAEPAVKERVRPPLARFPLCLFAAGIPDVQAAAARDALADDFDPAVCLCPRPAASRWAKSQAHPTKSWPAPRGSWPRARITARLHVWQRDLRAAGDHGYEPGASEAAPLHDWRLANARRPGPAASAAAPTVPAGRSGPGLCAGEPGRMVGGLSIGPASGPTCWEGGYCESDTACRSPSRGPT